jgi:hypothetical protein
MEHGDRTMRKTREFENILDECLERVLHKGATVEQCLAGYPEYAADLEPLLRTALAASDAAAVKPRPEFRERARYQFQAALREMEAKPVRSSFRWQPRWAVAVSAVVILLLAGSGTVAAASSSLPDEPLYPVKLATETVQLRLTLSALSKAKLYVKFADRRVAEIVKMADKGKTEQVERLTQNLNSKLVAAADLSEPVSGGPEEHQVSSFGAESPPPAVEAPQLRAPAATPAPTTVAAPTAVPAPATVAAPTAVPAPTIVATPVPAPAPDIKAGLSAGVPEASVPVEDNTPGKVSVRNSQARMREILRASAEKNLEVLKRKLASIPEGKPALRRALEEAITSYERTIGQWDRNR